MDRGVVMDGRCATCRHWSDTNVTSERDGYKVYTAETLAGDDWLPCQLLSRIGGLTGSKVLTIGADPYVTADIWTAPDFGCVQYEAKG